MRLAPASPAAPAPPRAGASGRPSAAPRRPTGTRVRRRPGARRRLRGGPGAPVVMLLENNAYPADVRVRREAESLAAAGYAVTVVAPRAPGQRRRETVRGVRAWRFELPETPATTLGFVLEYGLANLQMQALGLVALLRGARVVHLHNPPDTLFPIARIARLLGRHVIYDQHDLAPELFRVKFGDDSPVVRAVTWMERRTYRVASVVVVPNESHRRIALERGGVDPGRIVTVRNAPPADTLVAEVAGRTGPLRDPRLLFLGSMEAQDGVDTLPEVMRRLRDHHGLAPALTLVGDGTRRAPLERALRVAGFADRTTFTGRVPLEEVPGILAEADICLDPAVGNDLNHRSTMIKIAEYMAAGKPVVAHRLLETERTAGSAAVFSATEGAAALADAVAGLARDPERRARVARAGLLRVRDQTWERSQVELLRAYSMLAGPDGHGPAAG